MHISLRFLIPCLLAGAAVAQTPVFQIGGSVGGGWLTAPSSSSKAQGLRPTWVVLGETWYDRGPIALGLDVTMDYASRESDDQGLVDQELLVLTSGVLMLGTTLPLTEFPARVRLGFGGGILHSWNDLDRGGQHYFQEGWGPEVHLSGIWERDAGSHGLIRIRLAGVFARTLESEVTDMGMRPGSDFSRLEFTLGWSWRS